MEKSMSLNKNSVFFVDNQKFSTAILDYNVSVEEAKKNGTTIPQISDYIGDCFLRIVHGLLSAPNFRNYPHRDQMESDALHDCIKGIHNFNETAFTRTGKLNAHSYFSTAAYWAMVRRIKEENGRKRKDLKLVTEMGFESFVHAGDDNSKVEVRNLIERLAKDAGIFEQEKKKTSGSHYGWSAPKKKKKQDPTPLDGFMDDKDE